MMMQRFLNDISTNYVVTVTQNHRIKIWRREELRHENNTLANLSIECCEKNHLQIQYTALTIFDESSLLHWETILGVL